MYALGIDLGTATLRAATCAGRAPEMVVMPDGSTGMPAVVSFGVTPPRTGRRAASRAVTHPAVTVRAVKRLLGRSPDDPVLAALGPRLPFGVLGTPAGMRLVLGEEQWAPEDVTAALFAELARTVSEARGGPPASTVLTVPYWFGPRQREALSAAAKKAGLGAAQIFSEASATGLSLLDAAPSQRLVAIVDAGASGSSVSLVELGPNRLRLVSAAGDPLGGGDDVDWRLSRIVLRGLRSKLGELADDRGVDELLRVACEGVKHRAGTSGDIAGTVPFLPIGPGLTNQAFSVASKTLDISMKDSVQRLVTACRAMLEQGGVTTHDLAAIYVTGGLGNMPHVRAAVERTLGPIASRRLDPDGAVALGAATQAAMAIGLAEGVPVLDVRTERSVVPPSSATSTMPPPRLSSMIPAARPSSTMPAVTPSTPPPSGPPSSQPPASSGSRVSPLRPGARTSTTMPATRISSMLRAASASMPPESTRGSRVPTPMPGSVRATSPSPSPTSPASPSSPPASQPAASRKLDADALRMELAGILSALRAGALTQSGKKKARRALAHHGEIDEEEGLDDAAVSRNVERLTAIFSQLAVVMQTSRQYRWEHPQTERQLAKALDEIHRALADAPRALVVDVRATQLTYRDQPVWTPARAPLDAVPYQLFSEGVRRLQLKPGVTADELVSLLGVLARDPAQGFGPDDDAATALWDRSLAHVGYLAVDAFADGDDPEFQELRDEIARQLGALADLASDEVLFEWAADKREARELAASMVLGDAERAAVGATIDPNDEVWLERFASRFADAEHEARRLGDADRWFASLDGWAREQVEVHAPRPAFELFLALESGMVAPGARRGGALLAKVADTMFPADRVVTLLAELRHEAHVAPAVLAGLERVLERAGDPSLFATAAEAYATAAPALRETLVRALARGAAGNEAVLATLLVAAEAEHALVLVRSLRELGTAEATRAVLVALRSPHHAVRLEALAALPSASAEQVRDEVQRLLDDPDLELRKGVLRTVAERRILAMGPALVHRVQDRRFHDLPEDERRLVLGALGALHRRRAEELAIGLLDEGGLFRSEGADKSRVIAAEFLGDGESQEALDCLQRVVKKRFFASSTVRDAAARASDAVTRRRSTRPPT
jgi:actin-like ATPase involved in cell morphogenesis